LKINVSKFNKTEKKDQDVTSPGTPGAGVFIPKHIKATKAGKNWPLANDNVGDAAVDPAD